MKIHIESTTKTVFLDGVQCRIWEGHTETGIPMHCYIARVAVADDKGLDTSQFEAELRKQRKPSAEVLKIPLWMIL